MFTAPDRARALQTHFVKQKRILQVARQILFLCNHQICQTHVGQDWNLVLQVFDEKKRPP